MEFIKGIFRSISWNIGKFIAWALLIAFIGFAMNACEVKAITIQDSASTISDNYLKYFEAIFDNNDYKYYVIVSTYDTNSSYSRQTYYLCLTNNLEDKPKINDSITCDKQYSYSYNNGYELLEISDKTLNLTNSISYSNYVLVQNEIFFRSNLILVSIILLSGVFINIFLDHLFSKE
ncbi:MAG: hypothetical protein IJY87_04620 [Bacilli bacterium]|nr:hypothetical protein [Bacilli bacterium]